ncbi:hypothetical protein JZ751_028610 [Albula glossodonta]|uniref:Uncharacterized protein n=1 Tax=Albula glossodonta TaxID=121402 RepID=A0A8T2MV97_9TELE|nr:hypothetical protein JZ751_028610 [Albula glossodonta]
MQYKFPKEITQQTSLNPRNKTIRSERTAYCFHRGYELPAPILDDIASPRGGEEGQAKLYDSDSQDSMKIAWRYQNLPKVQTYSSDPRR